MRCEEVKEMLPAHIDEPGGNLAVRRHLSRCDDCKLELERYETLAGSLDSLAAHPIEPPPGLLRSLQAIPTDANRVESLKTHVLRNRNAYLRGAAVVVAGAAGAALWRSRRRLATA